MAGMGQGAEVREKGEWQWLWGALCRWPFEVVARTLGLKSRKAGYISHPSLNREIGFGQE